MSLGSSSARSRRPAGPGPGRASCGRAGRRRDVRTAAVGAAFVLVVAVAGTAIQRSDHTLFVDWPPLYAQWMPHLGPGTPAALAVAAALVTWGPRMAARLPWRRLVLGSWLTAMVWTWSLALVDGWHRGVAERLTTEHEYLRAVDRFDDIGQALSTYTQHILLTQPDHWPAHVSGHPPAAVLTFVALDRIGLGGGGWAGAWCITVGSSAAAAILIALRALADEDLARRAAPFLVLAPAAVWTGASADGYFAAVAAWGLTFLVLATTRTAHLPTTAGKPLPAAAASGPAWRAVLAGLLLGLTAYLSYGLTLMAIPVGALLLFARTARPLPYVLAGAAAVAAAFTLSGFRWWEGYDLLVERYYQGVGSVRPYSYWIWGNLANALIIAGIATLAGVRRAFAHTPAVVRHWRARTRQQPGPGGLVILVLSALAMIAVADLSGMSKAETERIWLPFTTWLLPAAALLPPRDHRGWLLAQAVLALSVNHLLLTGW
ncbi:hypothetical protein [Streptomyces sp. XD-27]|uniref:hypothetical protein n=1 Tax=Streptomyces sp. XD-27 TaxID=3062779 RepID=UPI0026F42520|nr:hypothetical protein [Streptomyces sp. XD-27]WKX68829.1 hypothetical protein Q3Y56_01845 [Streptomyces sp. XD-27]